MLTGRIACATYCRADWLGINGGIMAMNTKIPITPKPIPE